MAKLAIPAGRNRIGEKDSVGNREYVQLSLKGRWIALAKRWMEQNCPCSIDQYYSQVTPLMPTHIAGFRSCCDPKMACAKSALNRLMSSKNQSEPYIKIEGDTIEYLGRNNSRNLYRFAERLDLNKDSVIDFAKIQFRSGKEVQALRMYLKSKGFSRVAKNMYAKNTTLQEGETI